MKEKPKFGIEVYLMRKMKNAFPKNFNKKVRREDNIFHI
jgi:hypothetical protein